MTTAEAVQVSGYLLRWMQEIARRYRHRLRECCPLRDGMSAHTNSMSP